MLPPRVSISTRSTSVVTTTRCAGAADGVVEAGVAAEGAAGVAGVVLALGTSPFAGAAGPLVLPVLVAAGVAAVDGAVPWL